MAEQYFLGVELRVPALVATVTDTDGAVRAKASSAYETQAPQPGWSEQRPDDWWRAFREACGALGEGIDLRAVGTITIGGQHGSVFLDVERETIRPAILSSDDRARHEAAQIEREIGIERLVAITGGGVSPGSAAAAMLWLRGNATIAYKRLHHVIAPKDYLWLKLTGELATDIADASATGLFDVRTRTWSTEIIDLLDLDIGVLPLVRSGTEMVGRVRDEAAAELGLAPGVSVAGQPARV